MPQLRSVPPRRIVLAGLLLAACAFPPASREPPDVLHLDYTVRIGDPSIRRVEVELTLAPLPEDTETVTLALPERFAFVGLEAPLLEGPPVARDACGRPLAVQPLTPFRWRLHTGGVSEAHVSLTVPLAHRELPEVRGRDSYEFPYLAPDHGMLVAGALLLAPEDPAACTRLRFVLPEGWPVHCPWPESSPGVFVPDSLEALRNDLFAVGHWRSQLITASGCEVTVAVAPGQGNLLELVGPLIRRIVTAEVQLFGRVPRPRYLFLFGRPDPPPAPGERSLSLAGSPKTGSMTLMVRGIGRGLDPARDIGHLVAHEFHHTWAAATVPLPDELRFVGEGFTEYYAWLVLAREGLIPWRLFAEALGRKLRSELLDPERGRLSLAEAGGPAFFEDGAAQSHVYDGGTLLAALADRWIQAAQPGRSLDDAMRAFFNDPGWREPDAAPTVEDFFDVLGGFCGEDRAVELARLARNREPIPFAALLSETGAPVIVTRAPPELRLRANLDGTRIRDLDRSGLGARLGLRAGDILLEVNGVTCSGAEDVRRAWREPRDGRIRFTFERDGHRHVVDETIQEEIAVTVAPEPWKS